MSEVDVEESAMCDNSVVSSENVEVGEANKKVGSKYDAADKTLYAYLERDKSTTEKYKIEIRGLPKFYGISEFKKFLNDKLQLNASKIKPQKKGNHFAYVCFRNDDDRMKAISVLDGIEWKRSVLSANAANPAPDPYAKRKLEANTRSVKRIKTQLENASLSPEEQVALSTTPLYQITYNEQLDLKHNQMKDIITTLVESISKVNPELTSWFKIQSGFNDGLPIQLKRIGHSNTIDGYRNKCEFTIGYDVTQSKRMIGFRLSSYASGSTAVGPIHHLRHIPEKMKTAIRIFEKFVCDSELDVFDPITNKGNWKQVTVRTTQLDHLMLIVAINPQELTNEDQEQLREKLKKFFEQEENLEAGVTSLYFQTIEKKTTGGEGGGTITHISGAPYIEEMLLGMKFRISPQAFFQINTLGAEILYETAIDLAQPSPDTALIDVCCGTGTIGISCSKHFEEVLGIEIIPNAIQDAKVNAKENNVNNCEFFVGKAEDILQPVMYRSTKSSMVAIVDPPRAGLHQKAIMSLRKAKKLEKLIYISCDPKAAMKNLIDLARPNSRSFHGEPLVPVKAAPVDMFPHTKHCELILYLERVSLL
ncbi:hypothetical protein QAD02_011855 [Eretmocerus hayati]|uniref:Uncharacterized protein n=1 Tax=Eretmocerus hayati TaxID=131215 RepID=A0ACC2P0K3_9HYME|nr:hypothetical protein QAD02_011855 [Eretmocerus hayati]